MKQQTKQTKKSKISYKQLYVNEKKKRENTETKIEQYQKEIEILKKTLEEKDKEIENHKKKNGGKNTVLEHKKLPKGSQCSVSGNNYEKEIYNICKKCDINNKPFNTQREEELGGNTIKNDIECNFIKEKDIGIEIKKSKTPDWMQCCIKYNNKQKKWEATEKGKIPIKCRELFNKLINNIDLYDGEVPLFMEKLITHEEWIKIKKETTKWDDKYITIPSDSISRLYQEKGCNYIQISDGYGLYHLGKDICNFNVPLFNIEQQIRIRTKIHTKKNKKGFCSLSVTVACQPKNIKKLIKSNYSLDNKDKLPSILIYKM